VYEHGYILFEKLRVYNHEPKSLHRIRSELEHPHGYALINPPTHKWVFVGPR